MKAGDRAEKIAAGYLQRKGLALIETHYRCRWGEIDLILRDRDTVVFTEVRLRRSKDFGGAGVGVGGGRGGGGRGGGGGGEGEGGEGWEGGRGGQAPPAAGGGESGR